MNMTDKDMARQDFDKEYGNANFGTGAMREAFFEVFFKGWQGGKESAN